MYHKTIEVNLELTWQYPLSKFRPKQTKAVCVNQVEFSLWASLAVCMITLFSYYVALYLPSQAYH